MSFCDGERVKAYTKSERRTFRLIIHLLLLAKGQAFEAFAKGACEGGEWRKAIAKGNVCHRGPAAGR